MIHRCNNEVRPKLGAMPEKPEPPPAVNGVTESNKSAEELIREQLKLGDEAAKRGEIVAFDPTAIKAAGRARLNQRDTDSR